MTLPPAADRLPAWLEDAWLARYLERRLTESEAAWFEAYVLDKPELLARVDADSDLRDAVASERGAAEPARSSDETPASPGARVTPLRPMPAQRSVGLRLAWAASVLVAIGAGAWVSSMNVPAGPVTGVVGSPTRIVFETMRGAEVPGNVYPGDPSSRMVLIEVDIPPDATEIVFVDPSGAQTPLRPGTDGFASVLVPRALLATPGAPAVRYTRQGQTIRRDLAINLPPGS
jgi:hypothetical protein